MNLQLIEMPLKPTLQILLLLAIIILASKGAGAITKRLGQPAVLGELLVGLILGPTALNLLHWAPFTEPELLDTTVKHLADLGVIFLMFLAGLETDLVEMRRVGTAAFMGASGGVILPFIGGTLIGKYMGGYGWYESIFIGTILTATSVSISAQTLLELGQLRSKEGTTILGAAVIDDVMGIIVLSVVIAMHASSGGSESAAPLWWVVVKMVAYFGVAIWLGDKVVPKFLRWASRWPGTETGFAMAIVVGLLFAFAAESVGQVAAITGSYVAGVLIARHSDIGHQIAEKLGILAYGFFVPIFFVSIGLEADAVAALRGHIWLVLWIVLAAIVLKVIGSGLGVRAVRFSMPESVRVGIGMISRGEVALIVSNIGLDNHVISRDVFSVMVIMTLATTLVTPILLRLVFKEEKA